VLHRLAIRRGGAADELLQALFERRAFEEDAPVAGKAAQADVGPQASDLPVGAAAGVGALEAQDVAEVQFEGHLGASSWAIG
jgi:hypothetical protein